MSYTDPKKRAEYSKQWRLRNPDKVAAYGKRDNKRRNAASFKWKLNNPEKFRRAQRNRALKNAYGITIEQYEAMFKMQNGLCAICQRPESRNWNKYGESNNLSVDHNHDTKKVRALLCGDCNKGIGMFRDDILYLQSAIEYLKIHLQETTQCG